MCADGRAHQKLGCTSISQDDFLSSINQGIDWVFIFLLNFSVGKSSNEDWLTVPDDLHNLTWWQFRDIHFHVCIFIVSLPAVQSSDDTDSVGSSKGKETSIVDGGEDVELGSSDIGFVLIVNSVFVKPVIDLNLEVDVVTKVSWTSRGDEELWLIRDGETIGELLV